MKIIASLLALALFACSSKPSSTEPVTIYAAASLKEMLTEISGEWTKITGRQTKLQFEASSTLAKQIQEGAPANVFVTAAPEWLDKIKTTEKFDWLSNRLVCVVTKETKDFDLKNAKSLALANEQVPAGKYARAALANLKFQIPQKTIYGSNVRDVLSKVSQGGAEAGIVYATDVNVDPNLRVAFTFPPESHPKILYSVGLLTESSVEFTKALRESWAMEIASRHGFVSSP